VTWREYHEATKHSPESLARSGHTLDWASMPDPFRHYEGVPLLDLPADPPRPDLPALAVLQGAAGTTPARDGATFLSQLLFYSAAISATKRVPGGGYRYALRVNPSSGNLHPTEFHFATRGFKDWPDGLYHYRPSSHMAEQRALGNFHTLLDRADAPIVFVLTSIAWREAWKYRDRAYRYCLHDMGHAGESLALAAQAMGCRTVAQTHFSDDEISRVCRLHDDEWPMLIVGVEGGAVPLREPDARKIQWFGGQANPLSASEIVYESIEQMHAATKLSRIGTPEPAPPGGGEIRLPPPASSTRPFGEVMRTRRSALDFEGGARSISLAQLSAILSVTRQRFVQLYLYVHRVEDLQPGVYRYWPQRGELELIRSGDQRVMAAGLSLGQDLAGNSCVTFSMIADIERAARTYGDRGYRYVHFEAGAIGQRLYLAAEALGLRATGIGAFFDDAVDRYLNLTPEQGQVIYHFAIGYPVPDPRLEL
jgi:SagB-type dehydrogenase family enzyme